MLLIAYTLMLFCFGCIVTGTSAPTGASDGPSADDDISVAARAALARARAAAAAHAAAAAAAAAHAIETTDDPHGAGEAHAGIDCPICKSTMEGYIKVFDCGHAFCDECATNILHSGHGPAQCPMCRARWGTAA